MEAGCRLLSLRPQGAGPEPLTLLAWSVELRREQGPGHAGSASGRPAPTAGPSAGLQEGALAGASRTRQPWPGEPEAQAHPPRGQKDWSFKVLLDDNLQSPWVSWVPPPGPSGPAPCPTACTGSTGGFASSLGHSMHGTKNRSFSQGRKAEDPRVTQLSGNCSSGELRG